MTTENMSKEEMQVYIEELEKKLSSYKARLQEINRQRVLSDQANYNILQILERSI